MPESEKAPDAQIPPLASERIERDALILRGGGVKGLAFAGALRELAPFFAFHTYVGTSAGAIASVLLASGFSPAQLQAVLESFQFESLVPESLPKSLWLLITQGGLHDGAELQCWVDDLLRKQLRTSVSPRLADLPIRAVLYATAPDRGTVRMDSRGENANAEAAFAVRCSAAIPFYFVRPSQDGKALSDGGLLANFPIEEFLKQCRDDHPDSNEPSFLALYLGKIAPTRPTPASGSVLSVWRDTWRIMFDRNEVALVADKYRQHSIIIDPEPIRTTDFALTKTSKALLHERGREAALKFLTALPSLAGSERVELGKRLLDASGRVRDLRSELRKERLHSAVNKAVLWLCVLASVGLVVFRILDRTKGTKAPGMVLGRDVPASVIARSEGAIRILVAKLDGTPAGSGVNDELLDSLRGLASQDTLVQIVPLDRVITTHEGPKVALAIARDSGADLAIWGRYSTSAGAQRASLHFELPRENRYLPWHRTSIAREMGIDPEARHSRFELESSLAADARGLGALAAAAALYAAGRCQDAMPFLAQLAVDTSDSPIAAQDVHRHVLHYLAYCARRLGRLDEALATLHTAQRLEPNVQNVNMMADILLGLGRTAEARALLDSAVIHGQFLSSYMARAELLSVTGEYRAALRDINSVIEADSTVGRYYLDRADLHAKLDDLPGAVRDIERAVELDSSCAACAFRDLGLIKISEGRYRAALDLFSRAIALPPTAGLERGQFLSFLKRAWTYASLGDTVRAAADLRAARRHRGLNFQDYLVGASTVLQVEKQYKQASVLLDSLFEIAPGNPYGLQQRVTIFLERAADTLGPWPELNPAAMLDSAEASLRLLDSLYPGTPIAQFATASVYRHRGMFDSAEAVYSRLIDSSDGDRHEARTNRGWTKLLRGHVVGAKADLERAQLEDSTDLQVQTYLALATLYSGDTVGAVWSLRSIVESGLDGVAVREAQDSLSAFESRLSETGERALQKSVIALATRKKAATDSLARAALRGRREDISGLWTSLSTYNTFHIQQTADSIFVYADNVAGREHGSLSAKGWQIGPQKWAGLNLLASPTGCTIWAQRPDTFTLSQDGWSLDRVGLGVRADTACQNLRHTGREKIRWERRRW